MKPAIRTGAVIGTGAAINVECGFVPTYVKLAQSDGLLVTEAFLSPWAIPFTSGGAVTIAKGATIRGVTSRATAQVRDVFVASGTFAAGTAAGWLTLEEGSLIGTFAAEDIVVTNLDSGVVTTAAGGDATVTAAVVHNVGIAAASAPVTGNAAIARYEGATASVGKGFTIGSTLSAAGQLLRFVAVRDDN
jgi:hypothetical protein